jgi:hypothetical protein
MLDDDMNMVYTSCNVLTNYKTKARLNLYSDTWKNVSKQQITEVTASIDLHFVLAEIYTPFTRGSCGKAFKVRTARYSNMAKNLVVWSEPRGYEPQKGSSSSLLFKIIYRRTDKSLRR